MIEVTTMTTVEATGFDKDFVTDKRIVMSMSVSDAMALATILINTEADNAEWNQTLSHLSVEIIKAVNKCR